MDNLSGRPDILIVGAGKVGVATGMALRNNVTYHDPFKGIVNNNYNNYKHVIICVDTIQKNPKDYADLESVLDELECKSYSEVVVIRSTVSPVKVLEWDKKYSLNYIMFPEFMPQQENKLNLDNAWIAVLGGEVSSTKSFEQLLKTCGYLVKDNNYLHVSKEEACIIKLANNAGLSAKLTYFNSVYKICEEFGASYESVRNAIGMDSRIGIQHSIVPSPDDGKFGFGGHCLPKDILAIAELDDLGYFKEISKINNKLRGL